jgi:hypothetical protein
MTAAKIRLGCACSVALAAVIVPSAVAQSPLANSLSVALSSSRAGAAPVAITLRFGYEMQCGYPGPGPVVVKFPPQERLPKALPTGSVGVDGSSQPASRESGNTVSVTLPAAPAIMCDVIGPGRLTIAFNRSAGIGNPARAGAYSVRASRQGAAFSTRFVVLDG